MVQNEIKSGRPLGFDPEATQEAVMNLFWQQGYDGVSLAALEQATGLNRSSLYNSFGSKDAMFGAALERYTKSLAGNMLAALESGSGGLASIEAFLVQLANHLNSQAGRGCFMVNTMAAGAAASPGAAKLTRAYVAGFLQAVRAALDRAVKAKEMSGADVAGKAELLLAVVLGANLLARASQPRPLIEAVLASALQHASARNPGSAASAKLR